MKLWQALGLGALLLILGLLLSPVTACGCKSASNQAACLSNLKQIALAQTMYSADYDDRLSPAELWMDRIDPYMRNEDVLHHPKMESAYGYAFNSMLSETDMKQFDAEKTIMDFDSVDLSRNAFDALSSFPNPGRHGERNNVAYADAHAKSLLAVGSNMAK